MKRSEILQVLARRLSNRDVDDIYEDALSEMKFVQEAVLEKLPNQPWFLQQETLLPLPVGTDFVQLPADYNGLMTRGGVWFANATLAEPCGTTTVAMPTVGDAPLIGKWDVSNLPISLDGDSLGQYWESSIIADGEVAVCPAV